jgi:hypothetical protein
MLPVLVYSAHKPGFVNQRSYLPASRPRSDKTIETIAFPDARPPHLPPTPFSSTENEQIQQLLYNLDAEARTTHQPSSNFEQINEDLISLLIDHSKTQ